MRLIVASHNKGKIKEYEYMIEHLKDMGVNCDKEIKVVLASDLDKDIVFPEETGKTYEENAKIKAEAAYNDLKDILHDGDVVFGDDTGLEVKEMPRELGLYTARFLGEETPQSERNKEVVKRLNDGDKDRSAIFYCTIAFKPYNKDIKVVVGEIHGEIAKTVDEGTQGFGYDPIFIAREYGKPFSSCTTLEKIKVSHRGKAFAKMINEINEHKYGDNLSD